MQIEPQLHQQLLELAYGLLAEDEAQSLRQRIAADAALAAAWGRVQQEQRLLAAASRVEAPPISLATNVPADGAAQVPHSPVAPAARSGSSSPTTQPRVGAAAWSAWHGVLGLATAALLLLTVGNFAWDRYEMAGLQDSRLRLVLTGPAQVQTGAVQTYAVRTERLSGQPVAAEVEFAFRHADGSDAYVQQVVADRLGEARLVLPATAALQPETRLTVRAKSGAAQEQVETLVDVAPQRWLTYLSLDKPLYQPGETIFYRSLTLSRFGLRPSDSLVQFELQDPSGAVVPDSSLTGYTRIGVGNGAFTIPAGLAGGEYTLVARYAGDGASFPEQKRKFFIRQYRLPVFDKQLEFVRDSYGPGEHVAADFSVQRKSGGPAAGASLLILATVDGQQVWQTSAQASADGTYRIEFDLPAEMAVGDGQLLVIMDDGGTQETHAETIPINLGKVDVQFFPESGDLVAGIENRVYFLARDPLGEPVHIEGEVLDSAGQVVVSVVTEHEGMGSFRFTPAAGEAPTAYKLRITSPPGTTSEPELPAAAADAQLTFSTLAAATEAAAPLQAVVRKQATTAEGAVLLAAYCRGVQVAQEALTFSAKAVEHTVDLQLPPEVYGVVRVTLYDASATPPRPVAERLTYRLGADELRIAIEGRSESYAPGDPVELAFRVTDEKGQPRQAVLGVSVVDRALLSLADDKSPRMQTHFLLASEVLKPEDLDDANFFLSDDPEAAPALDLLLGVQGWRRFTEKTQAELQQEGQSDESLSRLVESDGSSGTPTLYDNLGDLQQQFDAQAAGERLARTRAVGTLGFFGSAILLLAVGVLYARRVLSQPAYLGPVLGGCLCCLIAAGLLLQAGGPAAPSMQLAFQTHGIVAPPAPETVLNETLMARSGIAWEAEGMPLPAAGALPPLAAEAIDFEPAGLEADAAAPLEVLEDAPAAEFFADGDELLGLGRGGLPGGMGGRGFGLGGAMPQGEAIPEDRFLREDADRLALREEFEQLRDLERRAAGELQAADDVALFERAFLADELMDKRQLAGPALVVREYSHVHVVGEPGVRIDFAETVYWHPLLVTDEQGLASVRFELSDPVTTFAVQVDAHCMDRLGSETADLISKLPFNLDPKLPLEVAAGDRIDLPLAVVNDSDHDLPVSVGFSSVENRLTELSAAVRRAGPPSEPADETAESASAGANSAAEIPLVTLSGEAVRDLHLARGERAREFFTLDVTGLSGEAGLEFRGLAGHLADAVRKPLRIVPPGFPVNRSFAGQLAGEQEVTVLLPDDWVPGSLQVTLTAYPSALASLQQGMQSIFQQPYGCFEQASTSNYPNVLALQFMEEQQIAEPDVTRQAKELLKAGYGLLAGYESPQRGYEWFGGDPGHEALTAYGLMEFRDMRSVYDVDEGMLQRTAEWLLSRRTGQGGFERNPRALDSFGAAPQEITDAYILWALTESGEQELEKELDYVAQLALASTDPYLLALAGASLLNAGREPAGREVLTKLEGLQAEDGHLDGQSTSITSSGGQSLQVETTALAAIAWLKLQDYMQPARKALEWLVGQRQGGGFGSTQATILALKALVAEARAQQQVVTGGEISVVSEGQVLAAQTFSAGQHRTIVVAGIEAQLEPGENQLTIALSGENQMPYGLDVSYHSRLPANDPDCAVRLTTSLDAASVPAGQTVALTAQLRNETDEGQPMTVAILAFPAGLELRPDQLEELKKAEVFDYYEVRARELICYWRCLEPRETVDLKLDLIAAIPGRYIGPASRAYLYYTAERKQWVEPLSIEIARPTE